MNNRYLFRAKRIDNGEWVCGSYVYTFCEDKNGIVVGVKVEKHWIVEENGNMVWVDEDTICQCTGLKDKNGKKIWENDVALRTSSQGLFTGKIIYDKNGCLCHREFQTDFEALLIGSDRNIEVIGNIFDNPELINE